MEFPKDEVKNKIVWTKGADFTDGSPRYTFEGRDPATTYERFQVVIYTEMERRYAHDPGSLCNHYYGYVRDNKMECAETIGPYYSVREAKQRTLELFNLFMQQYANQELDSATSESAVHGHDDQQEHLQYQWAGGTPQRKYANMLDNLIPQHDALWQDLREQLCTDYNQTPPQRVPLSQQKEFKTVRNMVIRETLRLSELHFTFEDDAISDEPEEPPVPPDPSAERMIHQQARFYRRAKSILDAADTDPSEKSMALVTLHRLWEEGYTIAAHQMGKAYRDGLGISIDRKAAAEWFQKSAEAGNTCSAYALGKLLLEQEQFPQALHWLRQAAEQNDPYAQYRLGKLLLTGAEGVPKDIDTAIQLLKDSATQGNSFAQYTLGKLYLLGQEVQVDREEALRYFAQAAAQDNTCAQYFIDHQEDFSGAAAGTAILRMLHQMSRIFRENAAQPAIYAGMQIDKKRRRRLQEKRMAMGHKADDHEDHGLMQQTQ